MRLFSKFVLIFCFMTCCYGNVPAQVADSAVYEQEADYTATDDAITEQPVPYNASSPTDATWETLTNDKAFGYKDKIEFTPPNEKPRTEIPGWLKVVAAVLQFFTTTAGHVILWSLLILIVGYVIYRIVSGEGKRLFSGSSKKMNAEEDTALQEEDLLANNWETKLQQALDNNDHRLAIRFSYMLVLQMLQHRNLIRYRHDKTNMEYYRELADTETRQSFRQMMRQYEYTWYGNYLPAQPAFDAYFQAFKTLKNKLGHQ